MDFSTDAPEVDPTAMADLHPLDAIEQMRSAAMRPAPSRMPAVPSAPVAPAGDGWRSLIQMLAPVVGALAMKGGPQQTGFLSGYSEGQQIVNEDKRRKAEETQKRSLVAANYLGKIADQADQITDPAQFAHFVDVADMTAAKAGYTKPGEVKGQLAFNTHNLARQQLKELTDQLASFDKGGYNLDELAQSGAVLQLKDGTSVPVSTAMDLARSRPMVGGKPLARPAKQDTNASTDYGRFLSKYAKDLGKPVADLTAKDELGARAQYDQAGQKPAAAPHVASGSVDAQFNDLMDLWKIGNPGKEPPPDVRIRLRVQAKKQIGQADDRPSGFAGGGMGGPGGLDPDGIDYAATEYRVTGKMPPLGMGNGSARTAIINTAARQVKTLGQSAAAAIQKQAAYKADGDALKRMTTMSSAAEAFENKALAQADIVDGLSQKVSRTNYPIINDGLLALKARVVGDANTQLLYNALTTFTSEYAKIMEGSTGSAAGSTDSARAAAARLISAGLSKGTLSQTLDLMRREMRLTITGYDAVKAHITDRMGGKAPDAPAAAAAPLKIGGFTVVVK